MKAIAYILLTLLNVALFVAADQLGISDNGIVILLILLPLNFIAILAHELGHATMARKRGARLHRIAVMPFEYDFATRKFGSMTVLEDAEVGGYVLYSSEFGETRKDAALIAGAGPGASLALAFAAFLLAVLWPAPSDRFTVAATPIVALKEATAANPEGMRPAQLYLPDEASMKTFAAEYGAHRASQSRHRMIYGMAMLLALLSFGLALINLIPFKGSDGDQLRDALFRP